VACGAIAARDAAAGAQRWRNSELPHIHELYTEARHRMGLPERPTTVRTMTPPECAERVLAWPHTCVQVIDGLAVKAQRGHLTPSEQRDLRTAINHLHDALTAAPPR